MFRQKGAGAIFMLLVVVLSVSGFVTFLKVAPLYTQDWTVQNILENLQEEAKTQEITRLRASDLIEKRFRVNGISDLAEHLDITSEDSVIRIEMEYERSVPLMLNLELVATFKHDVSLSE